MQIDYIIDVSPGKGNGVFAKQFIPKYTLIWDFDKANIKLYDENNAKELLNNSNLVKNILNYCYFTQDRKFIDIRQDDGRFFNHSFSPNIVLGSQLISNNVIGNFNPNSSYAFRDIVIGEELVDNYNTYGEEPEWYIELCELNNISRDYLN